MPYLRIQTNVPVERDQEEGLLSDASRLVSGHLGKDEKFFMGIVESKQAMYFSGSSDPLAFLELKALGLPAEKTKELSRDLCGLVEQVLSVSRDRIYVKFHNVNRGMWGWNGDVF